MSYAFQTFVHLQEGICAEAASFDLPSSTLSACITEANQCVDLAVARRSIENFDDKDLDPENFAILKGIIKVCVVFSCCNLWNKYHIIM